VKENVIPERLPATLFDRSWAAIPGSMAVHCVLSLSGRLDEGRLLRAVRLTLDAEPILGCRFVERWFRPYWCRYEDLDGLKTFEMRASSDSQADMRHFFEAQPDLPLRVLLLRSDSDTLCLKLDHHVGDGTALREYVYLLADIYNRLEDDPGYEPLPNQSGSRSLLPVASRFSPRDKWRILSHSVKAYRRLRGLGHWEFPLPGDGRRKFDYVTWRLDGDRVRAILEYGIRHRASVSQVLLAAFYTALREELPCSIERALPASMAIDLRRFLPETGAPGLSNLVGVSVIGVDPELEKSLEAVVEQIQTQMKSERKYLGLAVSSFTLEAMPVIRHLAALYPYGRSKRLRQKRQSALLSEDHVRGWMMLTNVGELDEARLEFGGAELTDAFVTGGVFRFPGLLGLGVSGFRGSLTLHLGCGPTRLVTELCERMMEILPTRSSVASKT
jgi:NRPS condensation-like uncharacterized protein